MDMQKHFYGSQDKAIAELVPVYIQGDFLCTKSMTIKGESWLPLPIEGVNNGVSNIRFRGDLQNVESIHLEIDGHRIDTIHPKLLRQTSFALFDNQRICPLSSLYITVEQPPENELIVDMDMYKIEEDTKAFGKWVFSSTQFTGEEILTTKNNKVKLWFNHPVEKITVIAENELQTPVLWLDQKFMLALNEIKEDSLHFKYEYTFEPPVNFSRMDNAHLITSCAEDTVVRVFAQSLQIGQFNNERFGLMFSK